MMMNRKSSEQDLRKAWLKSKFDSFEYHEELVILHERWRNILLAALSRAESDPNVREEAARFRRTYVPNIVAKPKPGDYRREDWHQYRGAGLFRSIPDYERYLEAETGGHALDWMTADERANLNDLWGSMEQMATNIRRTVDDTWSQTSDDVLLNERYTGPIDWPSDWRDQLLGPQASATSKDLLIKSGEPAPLGGTWQAVDPDSQQVTLQAGEVTPRRYSAYGVTVWRRSGD